MHPRQKSTLTASSSQVTQQDEVPPDACCSCLCASLGCVEEIEDLTSQEERTRGSQDLKAGSAVDEACTAGGTVRPALLDGKADPGIALVGEAGGDDNGC